MTKKKTKILANIIVLVVVLIILALILEGFLRLTTKQITQDMIELRSSRVFQEGEYINFELKPNSEDYMVGVFNEYNTSIKVNSLGWRDKEYSIEKPENTTRIIVLGDSFVFGEGVEENESWTNILEETLNQNPKKETNYEVISMGIGGYTTDSEFLHYKNKGIKYNPYLVILGYLPGNDIAGLATTQWVETDNENLPTKIVEPEVYVDEQGRRRNSGNVGTFASTGIHKFLNRNSYLYIFVKDSIFKMLFRTKMGAELCKEYNPQLELGWNKTKQIIKKWQEVADENNQEFIVVTIPSAYQYDEELKKLSENSFDSCTKNIAQPQILIKEFTKQENIKMIDLLPGFRKDYKEIYQFHYKIDGHWNKEGNKQAAKIVYEELRGMNYVK